MESRRKTKRAVSFSSSSGDNDDEEVSVRAPSKRARSVRDSLDSDEEDEDGDEELDDTAMGDDDDEDDDDGDDDPADDDDGFGDPDEDEEDIIADMMQPLVDTSKRTARQRGVLAEDDLMSLSNDIQSKKPALTADEAALRRSENARRRKNLSEKKLDEERQETINRLLNKQAGKSKDFKKAAAEEDRAAEGAVAVRAQRPLPKGMIRWVSTREGNTVSFPEEVVRHVLVEPLLGSRA